MTTEARARCRTCGGALPAQEPYFDAEEGVLMPPSAYCSIHCEHYAALAAASHSDETAEP